MLEHNMCCGTLCDKRKLSAEYKALSDKINRLNVLLMQHGIDPDEEPFIDISESVYVMVDGHDDAIVGYVSEPQTRVVYSVDAIVNKLVSRDKMNRVQAVEFYRFNIEPLGAMDNGPLFVDSLPML